MVWPLTATWQTKTKKVLPNYYLWSTNVLDLNTGWKVNDWIKFYCLLKADIFLCVTWCRLIFITIINPQSTKTVINFSNKCKKSVLFSYRFIHVYLFQFNASFTESCFRFVLLIWSHWYNSLQSLTFVTILPLTIVNYS